MKMSPHLSFDIQVEIIKRLPVKSLIQFRSVCKAWKSLIDSSQFITGYNFRHDQSEHLIVRYEVGNEEENEVKFVCFVDDDSFSLPQQKLDITVPPLVQTRIVIGSAHGLLCLVGYLEETDIVVLWNPAIRKSISVDLPNEVQEPFSFVIGFGVLPDTKDPKLVKVTYIDDLRKIESTSCIPSQVMVFTLSSGEWRPSFSDQLPRKSIEFAGPQTAIGQFIYLLACDWIAMYKFRNLIMSFDMRTEEFREIVLPDSLAESHLSFSRLRESLVLIDYIWGTLNKRVCDVWMMEHGDPEAFTKLFTINTPDASVSRTLEFRKNGETIVEMEDDHMDFETPHALVVYEPCSKHIKDLGIRGNGKSFFGISYTESLLLLDHDDGHIVRCGAVKR